MTFQPFKKLVLVVLDGFGIATASHGNAVTLAQPANIDHFVNHYPNTTLQASGPAVGLPWGEMGNSEVGHLNLGAGRIVGQDLSRITLSIEDRSFFKNQAFSAAVEHVKKHNSSLHLMGLVSPGGVHSYDEHLYALLGLASESKVKNVYIHMFTDGRDTPPQIALESLEKLMHKINTFGTGNIASISGRFYAMDRAEHWNLTDLAYKVMVMGNGPKATSVKAAIEENYAKHIFDEMIPPTVIIQKDGNPAVISENDAVIQFNFRPDRALQMTRALVEPGFDKFPSVKQFKNLLVVTMTEYAKDLQVKIAFPPMEILNGLAEVVSKQGLRQFHVAESEKYAHVSVFFNGGIINPFPGEDREIVTSPMSNYQNYQDIPEMSAYKVTDALLSRLNGNYSFFLVNYANPDMVGHTGNVSASIQAIKVIDECLKKLADACLEQDICMIITADHGNIEELLDIRSGGMDKEHSTNPVPFILVGRQFEEKKPKVGGIVSLSSVIPVGVLSDVSPTVLELMGMAKPAEMTGISLLPQLLKQI
ncbi:MAG: phosphoglycerate mutase (2,3-diphosphoglycerate-independent) [Candidatus Doudnabacteria bacterium RIFCSPHIGHO2_12_FULL_48_11]|uniref:2,3-bisphosphoglycerate-independent phosphoglycerate mutase n=1 Tax=Candidatus Doudnabacteria bacterium RIFCSPHIGHO2_01_FULL_46_24 TaxID=1817825 RepID=A0A1F5NUT8_9BACT|nr:MAG: phosphoglycerate mutase (2,3-diphosphoglycerate-independent) [Candidatus Doudnabacteria bacterium RIFCSPHIGHO2_01_FULL_46_24]OGE95950.1 MAG: phosphoglycerate mutase (2,3-diphosphoglycerate-independent) [Candidatus Doudnabacteria bacterium RIFCSPHIGHO2_12_FULL_48_11]